MNVPPLLYAMRPILRDLIPTFLFIALAKLTGNALLATAIGMAIGVAHIGWNLARRAPVEALQWLSVALVIIFGGATLLTHDTRFIMAKPTLIYAAVGATMLKPGWQQPYVPPIALPYLARAHLVGWGYAWAGLMFAIAIANAVLALRASFDVWGLFNAFGPTSLMIALFVLQYASLRHIVVAARRSVPNA